MESAYKNTAFCEIILSLGKLYAICDEKLRLPVEKDVEIFKVVISKAENIKLFKDNLDLLRFIVEILATLTSFFDMVSNLIVKL